MGLRPCILGLLLMIVQQDARAGAIDYALEGAEHQALCIAQRSGIHVERPDSRGRFLEHRYQAVFGPAHLVIPEDAVAAGGDIVCGVGECDLVHVGHIGSHHGSVSSPDEHGAMLGHGRYGRYHGDGQKQYLVYIFIHLTGYKRRSSQLYLRSKRAHLQDIYSPAERLPAQHQFAVSAVGQRDADAVGGISPGDDALRNAPY